MTSPSRDPVQEARDSVLSMFDDWRTFVAETFGRVPDTAVPMQDRERERLAAFESALRASLVERVVGKVEGMREPEHGDLTHEELLRGEGYNNAVRDVLAVLRAELNSGEGGK